MVLNQPWFLYYSLVKLTPFPSPSQTWRRSTTIMRSLLHRTTEPSMLLHVSQRILNIYVCLGYDTKPLTSAFIHQVKIKINEDLTISEPNYLLCQWVYPDYFQFLAHLSRRLTTWANSIPMVRRPSVVVHTFELAYLWGQSANIDQILCVSSLG